MRKPTPSSPLGFVNDDDPVMSSTASASPTLPALLANCSALLAECHDALDHAASANDTDLILEIINRGTRARSELAALEMTAVVAYDSVVRQAQFAAQLPAAQVGRGVAHDLGQARRVSPAKAGTHLAAACIAVRDLPLTMCQLRAGVVNPENVEAIATQVSVLTPADRRKVDAALAAGCGAWSRRRAEGMARAMSDALDQEAAVRRRARSFKQRRATVRPAPDDMAYLTALLPMPEAVACKAALKAQADRSFATSPPTPRATHPVRHTPPPTQAQREADLLVELLTGQSAAAIVPIRINLMVPAETLAGGDEPATISTGGTGVGGIGPITIPAAEFRTRLLAAEDHGQARIRLVTAGAQGEPREIFEEQQLPAQLISGLREVTAADAQALADSDTAADLLTTEALAIAAMPSAVHRQRAIKQLSAALAPPGTLDTELTELVRALVLTGGGLDRVRHRVKQLYPRALNPNVMTAIDSLRRGTSVTTRTATTNRFARGRLRELIELRDQSCCMPYCDAPIRDIDHITPVHLGGTTTPANLQGLCKACNLAKEVTVGRSTRRP